MQNWRGKLGAKYSKLPGIRSLHDFVVIRNISTNDLIVPVRELCYTGTFNSNKVKVLAGACLEGDAIPKTESYRATKQTHQLSTTKLGDLKQMYNKFIQREKWPDMILQ